MGEGKAVEVENFSHVCVGVSDMDTALAFYTDVLGMDVVFDVNLDGEGLESVTGTSGAHGRMVGGLIGGTMVELLDLGTVPANPEGPHLGYTNISFRVRNLPDLNCGSPTSIAGVRMLFVYGPDGTPIEFIELPGGATSTVEMWRPITG
jgi:glyoxylase I family protein